MTGDDLAGLSTIGGFSPLGRQTGITALSPRASR
jgi:hypothetical protein